MQQWDSTDLERDSIGFETHLLLSDGTMAFV